MVGGFNTNVRYKGRMFHVQTEDGGLHSPQVITLLYEGGAILLSQKSSYEEQLDKDGLEEFVRDLMEAQHNAMVKQLKAGKLKDKIEAATRGASGSSGEAFGAGVITDTPLAEVIVAHLARVEVREAAREALARRLSD